jgi:hypothetical protein
MQQAVAFIAAALAAEARGADSKTDVTHLALVVAGVIYYARQEEARVSKNEARVRYCFP